MGLWPLRLILYALGGLCAWAQSITPAQQVFSDVHTEGLRLSASTSVKELRRAWGQFMLPVARIEKAKGHWRMHIQSDPEIPLDSGQWVYSTWGSADNQSYVYAGVTDVHMNDKVKYMLGRLLEMFGAHYRWVRLSRAYRENERAICRQTKRMYRLAHKQRHAKDTLVAETNAIPFQRLTKALYKRYARRDSLLKDMAATQVFR